VNPEQLTYIIKQGEGVNVEFKSAYKNLNKSVFETVCAFLNRSGGHLLLGIKDDGTIEGVQAGSVQKIIDEVVTLANNPQKLNPTFYISAQVVIINKLPVIYIYVPESSLIPQVRYLTETKMGILT